jgi:hypothetical protein
MLILVSHWNHKYWNISERLMNLKMNIIILISSNTTSRTNKLSSSLLFTILCFDITLYVIPLSEISSGSWFNSQDNFWYTALLYNLCLKHMQSLKKLVIKPYLVNLHVNPSINYSNETYTQIRVSNTFSPIPTCHLLNGNQNSCCLSQLFREFNCLYW